MVALSPREQEVKEIVYDDGQPYERAAEWLDLAIGTVNVYVHRLRRKYRDAGETLPDNRRNDSTH